MRGFSAPICCGRPAARSAAASGQAPEKRRRLDELMSVLQRGDRLVVSEPLPARSVAGSDHRTLVRSIIYLRLRRCGSSLPRGT